MPKKLPKNRKTWVSLARDFVKEWPEVLDGLSFTHMPVNYLKSVNITLRNNLTIHYDVSKEIKLKTDAKVARFLRDIIHNNYFKIKNVDLKFDIPLLKNDIESKTSKILSKSFK